MSDQDFHYEDPQLGDGVPNIDGLIEIGPTQRTPVVVLLDCSGSMETAGRIRRLNEGLVEFAKQAKANDTARRHVLLSIITFGGDVKRISDWMDVAHFQPPVLEASGQTPMGEAVQTALATIDGLRDRFDAHGISYTRPWIILMSDGAPTDDWKEVARKCRERTCIERGTDGGIVVWPFGVPPDANAEVLHQFANPKMDVFRLEALDFRRTFDWLVDSLEKLAGTAPTETVQIPAPGPVYSIQA